MYTCMVYGFKVSLALRLMFLCFNSFIIIKHCIQLYTSHSWLEERIPTHSQIHTCTHTIIHAHTHTHPHSHTHAHTHTSHDIYLSAKDPTCVDYMQFSYDVESIFNHKDLEKTPTAELQQYLPTMKVGMDVLSPEEQQILQKTMH